MRFLIVAAIFAYAAASPSGLLAPYAAAPVAVHRLQPALPTISAGDINGAAIDAHVEVADHVRAAVDADRQVIDKVSELNGQAINNAEEQAWRAVDHVKTVEAKLDGAAASAAPVIAKNFARGSLAAPVSYAAPVPYAAPIAPVPYAAPVVAHPVEYAAPAYGYSAPAYGYSAPIVNNFGYASPLAYGHAW